jgi:hypothetical protein
MASPTALLAALPSTFFFTPRHRAMLERVEAAHAHPLLPLHRARRLGLLVWLEGGVFASMPVEIQELVVAHLPLARHLAADELRAAAVIAEAEAADREALDHP